MNDAFRDRLDNLLAELPSRHDEEDAGQVDRDGEDPAPHRRVTRAHLSAIGVVLVLILVVVAVQLMRSRPTEIAATQPVLAASGSPQGSASPVNSTPDPNTMAPATPSSIRVHVIGRVNDPGVHEIPVNGRIIDAIDAAGGMASGAHPGSLNMAQPVCDGCQILIPASGNGKVIAPSGVQGGGGSPDGQPALGGAQSGAAAVPGGNGAAAQGAPASGEQVDLNTATVEQLQTIDGVGPVMAERIFTWRQEHGRFTSVDELQEIDGIGPKKFAKLKDRVRVQP
ncbi:helix-hairpin-helix domain-containing protein [Cutibacterium granulosum]|uniref:helix-hairpin-helix domain-containing protein n=1 Tax=Cutibacterium granulosum TaxID=33011 RepID=UPI002572290B|nr:helix-hairpin-helix domain-containing protein [Cutibacterium granulosum]MDU3768906.1 helix-hairpin-helix domain-containing protein [Cutibacterium granulosum]MDU7728577.1 helix-hairpin-helix domain-containing protein [Cutibacterium granulosum]BDQ39896.1 membrane protein [Cutibacterium granulosum]